jgi:DNA-binding transcriptional LysR family regulator
MHFDFVTLRTFLIVAETENFRSASEHLNLSVSAVSRRVGDLEQDLRQKLFTRHSRGVEITEAGRLLLKRVRETFQTLKNLEDDFRALTSGDRGRISICANGSALVNGLAGHIRQFLTVNPDVEIDLLELLTPEVLDQVSRGIADIGFVSKTMRIPEDLRALPYLQDRLVLIVPNDHPLDGRDDVSFLDFLDWQMIGIQSASSLTRLVRKIAGAVSPQFTFSYMASTNEVARTMVANNLGIAILPETFVQPYLQMLPITMISISDDWAFREISIIVRESGQLSPAASSFLEWLQVAVHPT